MTAGQVDYYIGDDLAASFPVKTTERVGEWTIKFCLKTLFKRFCF